MRSLDLRNTEMGVEAAASLARAIQSPYTILQEVDVSWNAIGVQATLLHNSCLRRFVKKTTFVSNFIHVFILQDLPLFFRKDFHTSTYTLHGLPADFHISLQNITIGYGNMRSKSKFLSCSEPSWRSRAGFGERFKYTFD